MSAASPIEIQAQFPNVVPHVWTGEELLVSRGNEIFAIHDLRTPRWVPVAKVPWTPLQRLSRWRWVDRVFKHAVQRVLPARRGLLVSAGGDWWCVSGGRCDRITPGARTLPMHRGLCESASAQVYLAEYTLNEDRGPVRVFRLTEALRFETAWEFPPGRIRHIHALIPDPAAAGRIWVLTGDRDPECGLWYTDDEFASLHLFLSAGQESRATDLGFEGGNLYWGMDAPDETPAVLVAPRSAPERRRRLFDLPGPAYYMARNETGAFYIGTTVEPGRAQRDGRAHLLRFTTDGSHQTLGTWAKDWAPQHGILLLPHGTLPLDALVYGQRALVPNEGVLTIARDRTAG